MKDENPPTMHDGATETERKRARQKWATTASNRQAVTFKKDTEVGMEFCNGLLGMFDSWAC